MADQVIIDHKVQNGLLIIKLSGSFTASNIAEADKQIQSIPLDDVKKCEIDFAKVKRFDSAGAWFINKFRDNLKAKVTLINTEGRITDLFAQLEEYIKKPHEEAPIPPNKFVGWLDEIGRTTMKELSNARQIVTFLGEVTVALMSCWAHPKKIRVAAIFVFLQRVGFNALPIVGLISFLIGVILIYQGDYQLRKFGAEIYAIDLLAISMLREVGILITAIVIAGRSGSSFTAQIGTMKLNQEIDAMRIIGLNPIEVLVIPRMLALLIALPLLTFYTDVMGLLGGALMSRIIMDITYDQFFHQLNLAISNWTFWVGMIKAPVFAFIIALIGCFEGMQVKEGAESVGLRTTRSVVEAIFLVIMFNAAFSVIFTYLEI